MTDPNAKTIASKTTEANFRDHVNDARLRKRKSEFEEKKCEIRAGER